MIDWEEFYNAFRKPGFIAGYEIQNRLGGGAFGEVYKARKTSIGKPFAIKFLKIDDQTSREAIERELDQVRHFAQIDHPNLVTIEDMGVVMGVPYLIMGYAGEDTLARRIKREPLEAERALGYFVQCARGVLALHDRSLVHFDLKPSNVFLKGEIARVGDYGLAKLMTDGRSTLSFGRGTPHYMAPEMLKNRADHRADVYSLGVILFESIAGVLPFDGESSGGFVLREDDVPPTFPNHFPARMRPIVERCLRLQPVDRFESVNELLAELGQTARQGDSIVVPRELVLADAPRPTERPSSSALAAAQNPEPATPSASSTPRDEAAREASPREPGRASSPREIVRETARATATELARGAREVALGVWDGLRRSRGKSNDAPSGGEDEVRRDAGGEVRRDAGGRVASLRSQVAEAPGGNALAATIPVPPRVAGGLIGTITNAFALGVEVLAVLVLAPVKRTAFGFGRAGRGFVGRGRSWLGSTIRLMFVLAALLFAGAMLAVLAVLFFRSALR